MNKEILHDGDLILFHTKGLSFISIGIRMLTESFWNHIGMYIIDIDKRGFVVEALGRGVVKTPIEKYIDNKNYILKAVSIKPEAFKDQQEYEIGLGLAMSRMRAAIGQKYDWWAIAWLGFKYAFKGTYKKTRRYIPIGNPLQSREKFFCSEVVCESCYGISSIYPQLFVGKTKQTCDTTTPKDIGKSPNVKFIGGYDVV